MYHRLLLAGLYAAGLAAAPAAPPQTKGPAGPVVVMETSKGTIEFETYPEDAPKTVEHILALVRKGFYNGQRVHRVERGFVMQFGDPLTRDMSKRDLWGRHGRANSGKPIGVAEMSKRRTHQRGAVAMAHAGDPAQADSQIYITLAARPDLNGKYTVFGQVISGADVPAKIEVADMIKKMYVRETGPTG